MQHAILTEIEKRFNGIELLRPYAAATLLDPRYKKLGFENPRAVGLIVTHLGKPQHYYISKMPKKNGFQPICCRKTSSLRDIVHHTTDWRYIKKELQ